MKTTTVTLISLVVLLCLIPPARAAGSSGAAFLKIPVGARAASLGNAFTALADDASALYWNPGGLAMLQRRELYASHAELYLNTQFDYLGYAHPLGRKSGVLAVGAGRLTHASIEGRGEDRSRTQDFEASDMVVSVGFSRRIGSMAGVGVAVKHIRQMIADASASGFAVDFGAVYASPASKWSLGMAVANLGPGMKFENESYNLPLSVSAGAGLRIVSSLTLAADIKYLVKEKGFTAGIGMEFLAFPQLALRAGYLKSASSSGAGTAGSSLKGLGTGIGLRFSSCSLDYSFVPIGELGSTQRLNLGIKS